MSSERRKADHVAVAQPIMKTYVEEGMKGVDALITQWKVEMTKVMCLLGVKGLAELTPEKCYL